MIVGLPRYVSRPAEQVHLQPYACDATRLYGFFLRADPQTIQTRLVDPILNAPAMGVTDYQVVGDLVMVSFARAARGTSTLPPDNGIGFVPENSCTVWIPLLAGHPGLGLGLGQRLVFFPAYICV